MRARQPDGRLAACGARLLAAALAVGPLAQAADCPPEAWSLPALNELKSAGWVLEDAAQRRRIAIDLLPCLRDPDPVLRDELAFEALQTWLRAGAVDRQVSAEIGARLLAALEAPDPEGFGPPFAVLALSEVIRDDRLRGVWTTQQRDAVLARVARYLASIRDYRGFEPDAGWRHGVAHASDALMQFALNPTLDRAQLDVILEAVASQLMPDGHIFVAGESERLARPVLFVARRGLHTTDEWVTWFAPMAALATPAPGSPTTLESLARIHNLKAFVYPLYVAAQEGSDDTLRTLLLPALRDTLRTVP